MLSLHQWHWYFFLGDLKSFINKSSLSSCHKTPSVAIFCTNIKFYILKDTTDHVCYLFSMCILRNSSKSSESFKKSFKKPFKLKEEIISFSLTVKTTFPRVQGHPRQMERPLLPLCWCECINVFCDSSQLIPKVLLWASVTFRHNLLAKY